MLVEVWSGVWCQPGDVTTVVATDDRRVVIYFSSRSDYLIWPAKFDTTLDAVNAAKQIAEKINTALECKDK